MNHVQYGCTLVDPKFTHVLEFGVCKGTTIRQIREALPPEYKVFGFDSFEGLPEDWVSKNGEIAGSVCRKGFFSTDGAIPDVPDVKFYKGWFDQTIPEYVKIGKPLALLHVDCDLYSSTKTVFEGIGHLVVPGTIIVFDEWIYEHNAWFDDHEQRAFREWADANKREFEMIPYSHPESNERQIVRMIR